jgi:glucosamine kinase
MSWKIGVDGGGTKTECILVDPAGSVAARHTGPGCNPSLVGPARAAQLASEALKAVRGGREDRSVSSTLLCMAGSQVFWRTFGEGLADHGAVSTLDDSLPVLELATRGNPGLVLHSGTGSFVAARSTDGGAHYAGGLGWRFGDEGSGHDLGRRTVARALLELQGWAPASALGALVRERAGGSTASAVAAHFYAEQAAQSGIAALAPEVLRLADAGDPAAGAIVSGSVLALLELAVSVSTQLFPAKLPPLFRAAVSGHILSHPFALRVLAAKAPFPLATLAEAPIEGVRLLLARLP